MVKIFGISMTKQGLHNRTVKKEAVEFLKKCFERAIQKTVNKFNLVIEKLSSFSACYLIDSTGGQLNAALAKDFKGSGGSASKAGFRIQFMFDFLHGICEKLEIGDSKLTDAAFLTNLLKIKIVEKALYIFDLGYFKVSHFVEIIKARAYFLSRLKLNIALYLPNVGAFNLEDYLKKVKGNISETLVALVNKSGEKIRLICIRVPEQIANERRTKAKAEARKKGITISEAKLRSLDWSIFITNVPVEIWKAEDIGTIYKIRWQVELVFKTWKSLLKLQCLNTTKKERVYCEIYGKLIIAVILTNMSTILTIVDEKEISAYKLIKLMQNYALDWIKQINQGILNHTKFLRDNIPFFEKYCYKEVHNKKKTTIKLIDSLVDANKYKINHDNYKIVA